MTELSELDTAIRRHSQKNARSTNRAIAEAVHVAASTSLERIRILRERGVIRGYHAEADLRPGPQRAGADRDPHPPTFPREHRSAPRLGPPHPRDRRRLRRLRR